MITYTCTQCGAVKQETILAGGHKYKEQAVVEAACTEAGTKKYICEYCGDSYTEIIPAKGHSYDDGIVTKRPTNTETGIMTYTCTVCGNSYTEITPMLNSDLAQEGAGNTGLENRGTGKEKAVSVRTGDDSESILWILFITVSVVSVVGMVVRKRKYY